jgi:hypothetical protein
VRWAAALFTLLAWAGCGGAVSNGSDAADVPEGAAPADADATDVPTDGDAPPAVVGQPWSAPVAIDQMDQGHARGGLALDMDGAGNAFAVWGHSNAGGIFSIEATRFDGATKAWSAPTVLETNDADGASSLDLDVESAGNAVVVWRQLSAGEESIWSSWFDAGARTWHGAALVEIDNTGEAQEPCVAALPGGGAVAVWDQWDGLRHSLWVNRLGGAPLAWTGRSLLETTDSADALEPDVATDPQGNAVAVWTEDAGAQVTIWAARREPNPGTWTAPFMLSGFGNHDRNSTPAPRVALDAAGNGLAIWSLRTGLLWNVWASRYHADTGVWDAAVAIGTADRGNVAKPDLAIDASGNAFATWVQSGGQLRDVWANRFVAQSGTWAGPVRLDALDGITASPSVGAGGDRQAVVVWQQSAGSSRIFASRFDPRAGTWGPPALLSVGDAEAESARVTVDAAGNALAIFTQLRGPWYDLLFTSNTF